jgi:hypothetical protein
MPDTPLKVGAKNSGGQIVSEILGQSARVCCYFTQDNQVRWEYYDHGGTVPPAMMRAIRVFDTALSKVRSSIPAGMRRPHYAHVAKSLFSALDSNDPDQIAVSFQDIERTLKEACEAPICYTLAGIGCSLLLAAVTLLLEKWHGSAESSEYYWAAICGLTGGTLSILQRASQLWSHPGTPQATVIIQGCSRALIGGIFGVVSLMLIKGGFVLSFLHDLSAAVPAVAFVAGASERLVPEMAKTVERMVVEN